jgi:hypothetical protein
MTSTYRLSVRPQKVPSRGKRQTVGEDDKLRETFDSRYAQVSISKVDPAFRKTLAAHGNNR